MIEDAVQSLWDFLSKHNGLGLCSVGVDDQVTAGQTGKEIFVTVRAPIPDFVTAINSWEGFKVRILRKVG